MHIISQINDLLQIMIQRNPADGSRKKDFKRWLCAKQSREMKFLPSQ